MNQKCPRCNSPNAELARYCSQCGMWLPRGDASRLAGRVNHPAPLPAPGDFQAIPGAADLCYHAESEFGGAPLLGTESLRLMVFNGGYGLRNVVFDLRIVNRDGQPAVSLLREVESLPRGEERVLELPSYELPDRVANLSISLVSAELASND
jgi:hypothetical protein